MNEARCSRLPWFPAGEAAHAAEVIVVGEEVSEPFLSRPSQFTSSARFSLKRAAASAKDRQLRARLAAGQVVGLGAIAWAEFLCGPVTPEQAALASALFPLTLPFESADAARAADFFNLIGRRRGSLADCMIAAMAVGAGAELATENLADCRPFAPLGTRLFSPP